MKIKFLGCWGNIVIACRQHLHACQLSHVQLCDPVDRSPLGSSVHVIFQARILEWVAIQGNFITLGSILGLFHLRHGQADSLPLSHLGRHLLMINF